MPSKAGKGNMIKTKTHQLCHGRSHVKSCGKVFKMKSLTAGVPELVSAFDRLRQTRFLGGTPGLWSFVATISSDV
jgi:hypothetical protein